VCAYYAGESFFETKIKADSNDISERQDDDSPRPHAEEQLYSCTECEKKFTNQIHLKTHTSTYHRGKYKCTECGKGFRNPAMLAGHRRSHGMKIAADSNDITKHPHDDSPRPYSEKKLYSCTHCEKQFSKKYGLNFHMKCHKDKYKCTECGQSFQSNQLLTMHKRSHSVNIDTDISDINERQHDDKPSQCTAEKLYSCSHCEMKFIKQKGLNMHIGKIHKGKYRCHECGKSFRSNPVLIMHKRSHSGKNRADGNDITWHPYGDKPSQCTAEKLYSCTQCEMKFIKQKGLNMHIGKIHKGKYRCHECGKSFQSNQVLNIHKRTHSGKNKADSDDIIELPSDDKPRHYMAEKWYSCTQCEKKFTNQIRLKSHISAHHRGKYKCTECGRGFRNPLMLTMHRRTHEVKAAADKGDVTEHAHDDNPGPYTEEKLYSCTQCEMKFIKQKGLNMHIGKIHKGKYRCHECGKSFRSNPVLIMHKRSHSGKNRADGNDITWHPYGDKPSRCTAEKLYSCTHCEMKFIKQKGLNMHIGKIHKGKFKCTEYGQSFQSKHLLTMHKRSHSVNIDADSKH